MIGLYVIDYAKPIPPLSEGDNVYWCLITETVPDCTQENVGAKVLAKRGDASASVIFAR